MHPEAAGQRTLARLKSHWGAVLFLAVLATVTYLPILRFPFISDDYFQIPLAHLYGPPSGWLKILPDAGFRYRFTYMELSYLVDQAFGFTPLPFYLASLALHILCTLLVYGTGIWREVGTRVALPAAAFFAIYEGHQEAVMWLAASMELLQFCFGIGAFLLFLRWTETKRPVWYALSLAAFVGALLSKESAVVFPVVMALAVPRREWKALAPFVVLSMLVAATALGTPSNGRLADGSFSLHAPVWIVFPNSLWRLFFIWGMVALLILAATRATEYRRLVVKAFCFIAVALMPYSFLLYMNRVPSRHTYLASLGLSWIVGAAWTRLKSRRLAVALAAVVIVQNVGTLWLRKREQYLERAAPTEQLIAILKTTQAPVRLHCFPYNPWIADAAAKSIGKNITLDLWPNPGPNCFALHAGDQLIRPGR